MQALFDDDFTWRPTHMNTAVTHHCGDYMKYEDHEHNMEAHLANWSGRVLGSVPLLPSEPLFFLICFEGSFLFFLFFFGYGHSCGIQT